ncbi:ras-related protein Rab-24 [Caerostris extrusa]|uniref:Ras-related protein Rab-24 n=1 Tax=Caerostris extrusa TaxID=172846 RepID=A0AAV4RMW0_CAEEX|nr:ras-related protein Rab-24 [Caerostris extrusa]
MFWSTIFITSQLPSTIGAAFGARKIKINGQILTLGLWDTAGSERYESISRIYYRKSHAAIVCYDLTNYVSFERSKFWVSELLKSEEKCRLYLCGTKKDLVKFDKNKRALDYHNVSDYADEVKAEVFETSSKTGEGVGELFTELEKIFLKNNLWKQRKMVSNYLPLRTSQPVPLVQQQLQGSGCDAFSPCMTCVALRGHQEHFHLRRQVEKRVDASVNLKLKVCRAPLRCGIMASVL